MNPDNFPHRPFFIFASYGNDSVALVQWAREHGLRNVTVVFSDTGWAAPWWMPRVEKCEAWTQSIGFKCARTKSVGLAQLVRDRKGWPRNRMQFCTVHLKLLPALEFLDEHDPLELGVCMVGVRREESQDRANYCEYEMFAEKTGGRSAWAPLVEHTEAQRNELLIRAGFDVLPHRSMECYPCINSNRQDLRLLAGDEERIAHIEQLEAGMGYTSKGKPRTMFRPYRHMGAVGIRQVVEWAKSERGKFEPEGPGGGCDSGMCGT